MWQISFITLCILDCKIRIRDSYSHPSAPSVKVSTLTSSLSGLPVTAPVGCPVSTKDESKARIPERVMAIVRVQFLWLQNSKFFRLCL